MIQKILKDKFIKDNIVFFIGSMFIAVLNYLYHPVMSRMLSVEKFGEVQAIISMIYIASIFLTVMGTIVVNIVSNDYKQSDKNVLSQLYKFSFYVIAIFSVCIIGLNSYLTEIFKFNSNLSFVPLIFILLVGIPFTFYTSYLRGVRHFGEVSISGIIVSGGKLVFAMGLVYMGFSVFGAISAIALATFCSFVFAWHKARGKFNLSLLEKISFTKKLKKELSYGSLIFISLGYVTFMYTSDVLFVKYFFDSETAGLYSGIATIARIIFFATASVAGVLLSSIKREKNAENMLIFKKASIIISIIGFSVLVFFSLFTDIVISLLIGQSYLEISKLLPLAGIYIFLVSFINMIYSYLLAIRDKRIVHISIIGFLMVIVLITLNHSTLLAIVIDYILVSVITIIFVGGMFWQDNKKTA